MLDVETDRIAALAAAHPGRLLCHRADVRDAEAVRRAVEATAAQFGRIDAAIHNACLCPKVQEARDSASHRAVFDVNYFGALHVTQCVLPHMRRQGGGRVFFTCSGVGITGFAGLTAYAPSKAALEALAKCCALECAGAGVTFHILHPPLTRTRSSAFLPVPPDFMAGPGNRGARAGQAADLPPVRALPQPAAAGPDAGLLPVSAPHGAPADEDDGPLQSARMSAKKIAPL